MAARTATFGLLPASISHEGYSAKPMHSYWDDFWALKGYASAVMMADVLGHRDVAREFAAARDEFRGDVVASLRMTAAAHRIDYLAGSAELGDFDPTSSTIAFAPGGDTRHLPAELVTPTFERYWREFVARRDGSVEMGGIHAVRAPQRVGTSYAWAGANARTNCSSSSWPAVARRRGISGPKSLAGIRASSLFVGDLPHAWVASDYIRSVLDLFAYERSDGAMVLAGRHPCVMAATARACRFGACARPTGPLRIRWPARTSGWRS